MIIHIQMTSLTERDHEDEDLPTLSSEEICAKYVKVSTLGKGAFGRVYLVEDTSSSTHFVLKQIAAPDRGQKKNHGSSEREAKLLSTLNHPNIVTFKEVFWTKRGRLCLVMTYCDNGDLHTLLKTIKADNKVK